MHPFLQRGSIIDGEQVEETHRVIEGLLQRGMRTRDEAICAECIEKLRVVLPQHMDFEQSQGGLFTWLEALLPERRAEVQGLMHQHAQLREALAELDHEGFRDFARMFLEHEAAENTLLEAARRAAQG